MRIEGPGGPRKPDAPKGPATPKKGPSFDEVMEKQAAQKPLGTGSPRGPLPTYPVDSPDREAEPSRTRGRVDATADDDATLDEPTEQSEREPAEHAVAEPDDMGAEADSDARRDADRGPKERAPIEVPRVPSQPEVGKPAGGSRLTPEIYHRVVEAARMVRTQAGGQELQLALRAPGYEGMNVRLSANQGAVRATFVVERLAQKEALEAQLPELRQRLQSEGIAVNDIQVELKPAQDQSTSGDARQDQSRHGETSHDAGAAGRASSEAIDGADAPKSRGSKDEGSTEYTL